MDDLISREAAIDALHTWFRDGFDEDKWWNSTHVLAAIEGLHPVQQEHKWGTCFECPLSHGCPKIKGCTNEQAIEYASQIPNDCPLSAQPEIKTDGDTISRQAALDILDGFADEVLEVQGGTYEKARKAMCELPGVQSERRKGQWERKWEDWRHQMSWLECSVCHAGYMDDYDYCPNCGAKMEGGQEE